MRISRLAFRGTDESSESVAGIGKHAPNRDTVQAGSRPLLVTGAHRSGTTWVGTILSADVGVTYLPEPFNVEHLYPGMCAARFPYWFMRVTTDTGAAYEADIASMLRFELSWPDAARASIRSPRACVRAAHVARSFKEARDRRSRPLVKDPIALFSAEWLADRFDMDVVVLIRHPAAFAASVVRLGWRFDFENFLSQPSLMAGDLAPFAMEIESAARQAPSLIDEAALLWKCIYATVDRYRTERSGWVFIRHEDLSTEPACGFRAICQQTGTPFSSAVAEMVRRTTSTDNPVDARTGATHSLMRDSKATTSRWRQVLDQREVAAIRASVEQVSLRYYTDAEWIG